MSIKMFLDYLLLEKRYSPNTITSYKNDLSQFYMFLMDNFANENVNEATHKQIRFWLSDLIDKGISPKSVNRKITSLKSFYKYLLIRGVVEQNPMEKVSAPKNPKKLPVFIAKDNITSMFDELNFSNNFKGFRERFILELFYATGIRLSELTELRHNDFNWHDMTVKVTGKRNKQRIIPLIPALKELYNNYIKSKEVFFGGKQITDEYATYVFVTDKGKKLYGRFVYRVVNSNLSKVSTVKKKSPHVLRHTFATHMLDEGADLNAIKEFLGHANLGATQVYTHNTIEKLKKVYKQAHPKA